MKFIQKVIKEIQVNNLNPQTTTVIFPTKRSCIFFKKYYQSINPVDSIYWLPDTYSIIDFVKELSRFKIADKIDLVFKLFSIYNKHYKDNMQFDIFYKWSEMFISDFNDIDLYCVKEKQIFNNLKELSKIESYGFCDTKLHEKTVLKKFFDFTDKMDYLYNELNKELKHEHSAYYGLALNEIYKNRKTIYEKLKNRWKNIIFCGFYALSHSERRMIKTLEKYFKVFKYYDADKYYYTDKYNEAGHFFRKNLDYKWDWKEDIFTSDKKNIEIIGTTGNVGQSKITGKIISKLLQGKSIKYDNTVVVLPEESLLFPLLNHIPDCIKDINVTMGYPLKNTSLWTLLDFIIQLHVNKSETSKDKFYWKDLVNIFYHPYIKSSNTKKIDSFIKKIKENNIVYVDVALLNEIKDPKIEIIFNKNIKTPLEFIEYITLLCDYLIEKFNKIISDNKSVELEYVYKLKEIILKIKYEMNKNEIDMTLKTFGSFLKDILRTETLPFEGEPLKGLQIMGLLETRCLDFENVIILSNNEGILPTASEKMSFIPYEIRNEYSMPTLKYQDSIFAYHFYRLITRAKNIYLLYNTETDEFGKGGKSRFIEQLLYEYSLVNKNSSITEKIVTFSGKLLKPAEFNVRKTDEIMHILYNYTYSPSMLNTYLRCSMQFYFKYILKLKPDKEVIEDPDKALLGVIVHQILQTIYSKKNIWFEKDVKNKLFISRVENEVKQVYKSYIPDYEGSGKNIILFEVIKNIIERLLKVDGNILKENKKLEIISLEKEYKTEFIYNKNNKDNNQVIILKGKIDRIDILDNTYRIMDYKNGVVSNLNFDIYKNITDIEEEKYNEKEQNIILDKKINKNQSNKEVILSQLTSKKEILQLLIYVYFFLNSKEYNENKCKIKAGLYKLKSSKKTIDYFRVNRFGSYSFDEYDIIKINKILYLIFNDIFSEKNFFEMTKNEENCSYCDYKNICLKDY